MVAGEWRSHTMWSLTVSAGWASRRITPTDKTTANRAANFRTPVKNIPTGRAVPLGFYQTIKHVELSRKRQPDRASF
jgi:hypothetical protein